MKYQGKTHRDLEVWKRGISFVTTIYKLTDSFPKEELYGLTSQIRRAAISIPSNIAEGAARKSNKEFIHYLYIALGSSAEIETQLLIAVNLKFISDENMKILSEERDEISKMLIGLIRHREGRE